MSLDLESIKSQVYILCGINIELSNVEVGGI
jgi:hypothetical protein